MEKNQIKYIPSYNGQLRSNRIEMPPSIYECTGIRIFGRTIKAIAFTTDVAVIRNINADAIMAVYPFTPQPAITEAIMQACDMPVLVGVGGGMTKGARVVNMANDAELRGAFGVIVNAPTDNSIVKILKRYLELPVIVTIASEKNDVQGRIQSGTDILNVAAGSHTASLVADIRKKFPTVAIIATGGNDEESIKRTIDAGANAISWTPPSCAELLNKMMTKYRSD
ncbi:MAG: hydrolase [Eubacteriales bacterium]|nr:hydrolase [Eubacteriales bacterium]MDD4389638.1 hydrolase [Eubacteriales bacterium]